MAVEVGGKDLCGCGREHRPASELILGAGAIERMASVFGAHGAQGASVLVVMDENTREAAGDRALEVVRGFGARVRSVVLRNPEDARLPLEPDADQVFRIFEEVSSDTSWVISVGSGCITDLSRFVAHKARVPQVAVATAASMDGYTSSVAPLIYRGFKRTYPLSAPAAVVADTNILVGAPARMTAAGFGDILGKFTANADWLVAHLGFGEYRCQHCWRMLEDAIEKCRMGVDGLRGGDPRVIEALAKGLIDSGIAISYVGNSRPASGAEHLISHAWEMLSLRHGGPSNLHGHQVGVATVLVAAMYEEILALSADEVASRARAGGGGATAPDAWSRDLAEAYGPLAASEASRETGGRDRSECARTQRVQQLAAHWDEIRSQVATMLPSPHAIRDLLRRAGAPSSPQELGLPANWVPLAFRTPHNLPNRYTALNLAEDLGLLGRCSETFHTAGPDTTCPRFRTSRCDTPAAAPSAADTKQQQIAGSEAPAEVGLEAQPGVVS